MPEPKHWFFLHIDCGGREFADRGFASSMIKVVDQVVAALRTSGTPAGPVLSGDGKKTLIGTWTVYSPGMEHFKPAPFDREFRVYINCDGPPFYDEALRTETIATALLRLPGQMATGRWSGAFIHEHQHTFGNWATKWSNNPPSDRKR